MVKINGQDSAAVVRHVDTEASGRLGVLFLRLEAPLTEAERWQCTIRPIVQASWSPHQVVYPAHVGLATILDRCSVEGPFMTDVEIDGDHVTVLLTSAGRLTDVESPQ